MSKPRPDRCAECKRGRPCPCRPPCPTLGSWTFSQETPQQDPRCGWCGLSHPTPAEGFGCRQHDAAPPTGPIVEDAGRAPRDPQDLIRPTPSTLEQSKTALRDAYERTKRRARGPVTIDAIGEPLCECGRDDVRKDERCGHCGRYVDAPPKTREGVAPLGGSGAEVCVLCHCACRAIERRVQSEIDSRQAAPIDYATAMRMIAIEPLWEDTEDEWTARIKASLPTRSGSHEQYATAMRMIKNRHSKGSLVALVNWLLVDLANAQSKQAKT